MYNIVPHLWFDRDAIEAARWYTSLFEGSEVTGIHRISETPSGDVDIVDFRLANLEFVAINAGPYFKFNPSISFMVACSTAEEVDRLHAVLTEGGSELMELGEYPFSKRYAWVADRYGVNWQLMQAEQADEKNRIRPVLLFGGHACGHAEHALEYYRSVFPDSSIGHVSHYSPGEAMDARARINYGELNVNGVQLVLMDHGMGGEDEFNEAVSLMVRCGNQREIDTYWEKLSHVPEAEQCGWLKDKFGVSWQIVPANMSDLMAGGTDEEVSRATKAMLGMKKLDIAALEQARKGRVY